MAVIINGDGTMTGVDIHDSVSTQEQIDSAAVLLTGDQTIAGEKTFSDSAVFSSSVGIGIATPSHKLEVKGVTGDTAPIVLRRGGAIDSNYGPGIGFAPDFANSGVYLNGAASIGFRFYSVGDVTAPNLFTGSTELVRITNDGRMGVGTGTIDSFNQFKVQTDGQSAGVIVEATGTNGYSATSWKTDGGYWQIGLRHDNPGDLVFRNGTSGVIAATIDTNGVFSSGNSTTKLSTYSDTTYSGIYNGTSLTSDECIYFGAGNEYHYFDGALGFQITGTHTYLHNIIPRVDNTYDIGGTSNRFDDIYATNGSIQTSDSREKQDIEELTEAEEQVAISAKGLLRKYRWKSSVEENGDDARIHFGIIAQDLKSAFEDEGLDAGNYGMFIHDTWTDSDSGEEIDRMGVRYSELLAFIIAAI
jgi:hypothetical protein